MAQVPKAAVASGDAAALVVDKPETTGTNAAHRSQEAEPLIRYPEVGSLQRYSIPHPNRAMEGNACDSIQETSASIGERSFFNALPYVEQLCELIHLSLVQTMHSAAGDTLDAYSIGVGLPNPLESTANSVLLSLLHMEKEKCDWQCTHAQFTESSWRRAAEYRTATKTGEDTHASAQGKEGGQTDISPPHAPSEGTSHANPHQSRHLSTSKQDGPASSTQARGYSSAQATANRIAGWCSSLDVSNIPSLARPCSHDVFLRDSLVDIPDDLHDPLSATRCGLAHALQVTLLPHRCFGADPLGDYCPDLSTICFARPRAYASEQRSRFESWHGIGSETRGSKLANSLLQEAARIRHLVEQSSTHVKGNIDVSFHPHELDSSANQSALYSYYFTETCGDALQNSAIVDWFYQFVLFCIYQSFAVIQVQSALLLAEEIVATIATVGSALEKHRCTDEDEDAAMEEAITYVLEKWLEDACVPQRCDLLTRQAVCTGIPPPASSGAADENAAQQRKPKQSIVRLNKGQKPSSQRDRDDVAGDGSDGPQQKITSYAPCVFGMEDVIAPAVLLQPLFSEEQADAVVEHLCQTAVQHWRLLRFAVCESQQIQRTAIAARVNDVPSICVPPLNMFYATGEYQRLQERRALERQCLAAMEGSFSELYSQPVAVIASELAVLNVTVQREQEEEDRKDRSDALNTEEYQHTQRALELRVGKAAVRNQFSHAGGNEENNATVPSSESPPVGAAVPPARESNKGASPSQGSTHKLATFEDPTDTHPESNAALIFSADAVQTRIEAANSFVDNMAGSKGGSARPTGGNKKNGGK